MGLKRYRAQRNLRASPEPKGGRVGKHVHRFVVQRHEASHLHYDFRLEWNGVLKSWAVPKGPPLDPKDKRLAVSVEDHPLDYRTFEGVIPPGNYGAGRVRIWDHGTYSVPASSYAEVERIMKRNFAKGHLPFTLHGKKLKGDFILVKMERPLTKNAWLFMKRHTDAAPGITTPQEDHRPMLHHVRPMLAELADGSFTREGWIFEMKWDGYRAIAEIQGTEVHLYSRNHQSLNERFPSVVEELQRLDIQAVLDGEIAVLDQTGKPKFQLLQDYHKTGKGKLIYAVFDLLYLNGQDLRDRPLRERKRILKELLPKLRVIRYSEHVERNGVAFFRSAVKQGLEGIMAKRADSPYQAGVRSSDWLKIKNIQEQEAVIAGYTEPRGSRKYLGAVILGVYQDGKLHYIGHTGAAAREELLRDLKTKLSRLEQSRSPFEQPPKPNAPVHWVKPTLVAQVKFQEWTKDGIMRQPIFLGLREDKSAQEVVKEESIKEGGKKVEAAKLLRFGNKSVRFTHWDKVFWPQEKITKGDVLDYYRTMARYLLPYLKDRPFSLNRFPNGIEGESFFQKDIRDAPSWVKTVRLESESDRTVIHSLICNNEATLAYLVQLGCIEMHAWNSRIAKLDKPDYVILDLDPEQAPFSAVVRTARVVKQVLDELGARSYCKTSGARGLHVYVPLGAKYTYEQARLFAELVAALVHERLPKLTSLEHGPERRRGKVYVDYPQNRRGATTVAAYSLRPRPGAPVSTPLRWDEVKSGLDPLAFNINTIHRRLKKFGDLWEPVLGPGIDLQACLERLAKRRSSPR